MRVTSHCINHPSKDASTRCRSCGKWLCDQCFQRFGTRVYCDRKCHVRGLLHDSLGKALDIARGPVHAAWVIAVVASASALLLTVVGIMVADLAEVRAGLGRIEAARTQLDPELSASFQQDENGVRVDIGGRAESRVLVLVDDRPLEVVNVDDSGRASSSVLDPSTPTESIRIVQLAGDGLDLGRPPLPSPTSTATATATVVPTATRRATAVRQARTEPTPASAPPVLQIVGDAGARIAITFDGNASSKRTDELLDMLQDLDLQVTLFVTGQFIEKYPAVIRRTVLAGHEIGNHTYSHPHLTTYAENRRHALKPGMTRERLQRELRRTEEAFEAVTGRSMAPLWRSPYGEENRTLRGWALEMGYLHVRWSSLQGASLDTRDWVDDEHSSLYQNSNSIMERLLKFPKLEGGLILMHLATERQEAPWTELPSFVKALRDRGLEPVEVTTILEASPTWRSWLQRARQNHAARNGE